MSNQTHSATNIERRENERALHGRGVIIWVLIAALLSLVFCLGVYFGFFAGKIIGI